MNHTPGPWSRKFGNYVYAGTHEQAVRGEAPRVAVCDPLNGTREELDRAFANAALIAAAPELLASLKAITDHFAASGDPTACDLMRDARAVIAKVEGGKV